MLVYAKGREYALTALDSVRWVSANQRLMWVKLLLFLACLAPAVAAAEKRVLVLTVKDAIGPATADYLIRGMDQAAEKNAALTVIVIDTPGGLDSAMRDIIQGITASRVPVVVYVAPTGARAASAGTYILYAAHVAAMAPGTNLGAATPVAIGGFPEIGDEEEEKPEHKEDKKGTDKTARAKPAMPKDPMARKAINDAVAYIRSLAQLRGRDAEWAEKAVREAASLSAQEALRKRVIDLTAKDLGALLAQLHGRKVNVAGAERALETKGAVIEHLDPDWRSRLLAVISNPNIAYLLMLLGVYGLFFELANPGFVLPGVIGAICLLLALYALQVLPVNYAGVALILLGIAFMVAEVFMASFGALGIGGVIAFVVGSIILFDTEAGEYAVSFPLIGGVAATSAAFFMGIAWLAVKYHRRPAVTGSEELIGKLGEAYEDFQGTGWIWIHGERWQALCATALTRGQKVRVTAIDGLQLRVEPETKE